MDFTLKYLFSFIVSFAICSGAIGQVDKTAVDTIPKKDTLSTPLYKDMKSVTSDKRLSELVQRYYDINKKKGGIDGFRIQIHFGSSKSATFEVQKKFENKYPETVVHLMYEPPNFRLRAGDFRNRFEANQFLEYIAENFPQAFIVRDVINLPALEKDCEQKKLMEDKSREKEEENK